MKKITMTSLCIMLFSLFTTTINAQIVGYTYSLVQNSDYNFSIGVVPDASTSDFVPLVQSYGFVIFVPDGATVTITDSFGNAANPQNFPGSAVGLPGKNGYLITETLGAQTPLPTAPSAGTFSPMVTIDVVGAPISGLLEILANDSDLTMSSSQFKSFLTADSIDDGQFVFEDLISTTASGLSGDSSFDFAVLSNDEFSFSDIAVYPNPTADVVHINTNNAVLDKVEIYNISGQLVLEKTTNLDTIDIKNLNSGMYMLKLLTADTSKTIKLIKQ